MKKLIIFLLSALLLMGCIAHAESSLRKTNFPDSLDQIAYYMPCCGGASFGADAADAAQTLADAIAKAGYTKDDFFIYAGCGGERDVGYAGLTAQVEAMKLLPDTFVYCENFRDGNLYYTQCSGGHSTRRVELIMYCALPMFFDK